MISIRENVFETNSSSCHSITLSNKGSLPKFTGTSFLSFYGGDWGWEKRTCVNPQEKFSYWLNAFTENQANKLQEENDKARGTEYYITDFIGKDPTTWNKTRGPALEEVYLKVLKDTSDRLKAVLEAFQNFGTLFTFVRSENNEDEYIAQGDIERYIQVFNELNAITSTDKLNLCHREFNYYVELGYGIDHQSGPREDQDCKALAELSPEDVVEWVFGDGYFVTDNDQNDDY